jgi:hypothetical protein
MEAKLPINMFPQLQFPQFDFNIRETSNGFEIWDVIRKRFVKLSPEEWVRQHVLRYLIEKKQYNASLMAVEYSIVYNEQKKRCDAVLFNTAGKPLLIIECKASAVKLTHKVLEQIARYNFTLNVSYLLVSNGMQTMFFKIETEQNKIVMLKEIPEFEMLLIGY